jgi:hypothetical protein
VLPTAKQPNGKESQAIRLRPFVPARVSKGTASTSTHVSRLGVFSIIALLLIQRNAGAVLHSHDLSASLLTVLDEGAEFRITHFEMVKGIKVLLN